MISYLKRISTLLFYTSSLLLCLSIYSCSKAEDDQTDPGFNPELEIKDQLFIQIIDGSDTITHLSIADFTSHSDGYLIITSLTLGPAISISAEVEIGDEESILDNDDDNFFIEQVCAFAHKEEIVGLVSGDDAVQLARHFDLLTLIVFLTNTQDQAIHFRIFVADKIQLVRPRLARMPDLVQVRVHSHAPAEHQGIKLLRVDEIFQEHRPFE